jgi:hypothetical protein
VPGNRHSYRDESALFKGKFSRQPIDKLRTGWQEAAGSYYYITKKPSN